MKGEGRRETGERERREREKRHTMKCTDIMRRLSTCILGFMIANFFMMVSGQNYACLPYNRTDLISPCSAYNPSEWAYIDTSSQTVAEMINFTNNLLSGMKSFGS